MRHRPPKPILYYDESTSFALNAGIREDIDLLKRHFRIRSTGDLMRHLIRHAKANLK